MRNENEQDLGNILKGMVDQFQLKNKLYQSKVEALWPKLMGPSIAGYTTNIKLRQQKLYVDIVSSPLRSELMYGKEKIMKLFNEELGEEYIKDVILR